MHAHVIAEHARRHLLLVRGCPIEQVADARLDLREERLRRPPVPHEEVFEPRLVAMLAKDVRLAEDLRDRANRGNHVVPAQHHRQSHREMRLIRQPAADAQ
jgi:hypothetical protein